MIKRIIATIGALLFVILNQSITLAANNLLFNVSATGTPLQANITLCLNGQGLLSCENHDVSASSVTISTTIPNHVYPFAGIKINTPGFTLGNLGIDCIPNSSGACLFSVSGTQTKTFSVLVTGPLYFTPTSLPVAIRNVSYTQTITAHNGVAPYNYVITEGSLPTGLSLDATTGVISGAPITDNTYNFTVSAADSNAPNPNTGSQAYTLEVDGPLSLSPSSLSAATRFASYTATITATGGIAPYTFTITNGSLPTGLQLDPSGVISGTPTITAGNYPFTVKATDIHSETGSHSYSLTVNPAASTTFSTPGSNTYTVPNGVSALNITTIGAGGGGSGDSASPSIPGQNGGSGARVDSSSFPVTPGQILSLIVGGGGGAGANSPSCGSGGGGGGASSISVGQSNQIIAGGGGGAGACLQGATGGTSSTPAGGTGGGIGGGGGGNSSGSGNGGTAGAGGPASLGGSGSGGKGGLGGSSITDGSLAGGAAGSGLTTGGIGGSASTSTSSGGGGGGYGGGGSGANASGGGGGGGGGSTAPAGSTYLQVGNGGRSASNGSNGSITITPQ